MTYSLKWKIILLISCIIFIIWIGRPGESLAPFNFEDSKRKLSKRFGPRINNADVLSSALYPKVAEDFFKFRELYGPVDKLSTRHFLVGPKIAESFEVTIEQGKTLQFKTLACSADLSSTGMYLYWYEFLSSSRFSVPYRFWSFFTSHISTFRVKILSVEQNSFKRMQK